MLKVKEIEERKNKERGINDWCMPW